MGRVVTRGSRAQACLVHGGKRYRYSFQTTAQANLWLRQAQLDSAKGIAPRPPVREADPSDCGQATLKWLHSATHVARWSSSRTSYMSDVGLRVVTDLGEDSDPKDIDYKAVVRYVEYLRHRSYTPSTINKRLSALSAMLGHGVDVGVLSEVPKIPYQTIPPRDGRWLTHEEEAAVLAHLNPAVGRCCIFLAETGLRVSEATTLSWRNVGPRSVTVTSDRSKTGKPRSVPLTKRAEAALAEIPREGRGPFDGLTRDSVSKAFRVAADKAGLSDAVVHTLRHTCASRLVMAGVDIRRVKEWMGHSSIETTMRYAHLAPQSLMDVVELVDRASRGNGVAQTVASEPQPTDKN